MDDRIRAAAELSVARGCGFAALAILTTMMGLVSAPVLALRTGGLLTLLMAAVLALKAGHAGRRAYRSTEVWIMLAPQDRPAPAYAQLLIGSILREVYTRFAAYAAGAAAALLAAAVAGRFIGLPVQL